MLQYVAAGLGAEASRDILQYVAADWGDGVRGLRYVAGRWWAPATASLNFAHSGRLTLAYK